MDLEDTFLQACKENDLTKVRACIDLGVNVNCEDRVGDFGLYIASDKNYPELCDLLISQPNIDVNKKAKGETALMNACWLDNPEIVRKLAFSPGVDLNCTSNGGGYTAAMIAAQVGPESLRVLAGCNGVDWNVQNNVGGTAAMHAVFNGEESVRIMSTISSVDWNVQDNDGDTPATYAAYKGLIEVLRILKDIPSIDWNISNRNGNTALTLALKKNHLEASKLILSIPSLNLQAHNLDNHNIPKEIIVECLRGFNQQQQQILNNTNVLMSKLGYSSPECPVCLTAFTAARRVFLCGNGHFTCGTCRERMESCPKCRADFIGRAHDYENILANNI